MRIRILILLFAISVTSARGAEFSRSLTLAGALARALEKSPALAAYDWDIRAADARLLQSRLLASPELGLEVENFAGTGAFRGGGETESTLQFSQIIETSGRRRARIAGARSVRELAALDYEIKRTEVLKTTTQAFIEALAAQHRVQLAGETVSLAEKVTPLTQSRVEAGAAGAVEVTRSNVAVAAAKIELDQTRHSLDTAKGSLAAQWGARQADFESVTGDFDRVKPLPALPVLREKLLQSPQFSRWQIEREKRDAAVDAARAEGRPDVTVSAGPRMMGGGGEFTVVVGVSLPLPLWNRNQGAVNEAQANLSKAGDEQRAAEAEAMAALHAAWQTLARAAHEAEILNRDVLPGAKEAEAQITGGYAAGRFSQLEILEARRTFVEARKQHLQALADYHKAAAELDALTAGAATNRRPKN
jgi:cobalt-zinc-cadmium efflux system outer membrane protein